MCVLKWENVIFVIPSLSKDYILSGLFLSWNEFHIYKKPWSGSQPILGAKSIVESIVKKKLRIEVQWLKKG
jgi:hypothetical protein